jgi:hypothetical protein
VEKLSTVNFFDNQAVLFFVFILAGSYQTIRRMIQGSFTVSAVRFASRKDRSLGAGSLIWPFVARWMAIDVRYRLEFHGGTKTGMPGGGIICHASCCGRRPTRNRPVASMP